MPGLLSCLILAWLAPAASVFDWPEIQVTPSPGSPARLALSSGERVLDLAAAPDGPRVTVVIENAAGSSRVAVWRIGAAALDVVWQPEGAQLRWLAWHPEGKQLFVAGSQGGQWLIWRLAESGGKPQIVYRSQRAIERLLAGPRPFLTGYDEKRGRDIVSYRLFFGLRLDDKRFRIESVTESGTRPYWVVGPGRRPEWVPESENWRAAGGLPAPSALPVAFHPAGHLLVWEDADDCFHAARYDVDHWESGPAPLGGKVCGGAVAPTPNGAALIAWRAGSDGVVLHQDRGRRAEPLAAGRRFLIRPVPLADGRGLAGVTAQGLEYVPVAMPLADVVNAWMFVEDAGDVALLARHGGLLRPTSFDQLYSVYESENYTCTAAPFSVHRRPFLVTTDIFWEIYAAAYQGLFILRERREALPAFNELVRVAREALPVETKLRKMFRSIEAALAGRAVGDPEAALILAAKGPAPSPVLGVTFDYSELKPRGHYAADPALARYFSVLRYLTWATDPEQRSPVPASELLALRRLPQAGRDAALRWIRAYVEFIAPPRSPIVWREGPFQPPAYVRHPPSADRLLVFPLGWGFDNEVLNSTVYHPTWPPAEQIAGPAGPRVVPSALDVAAALGSRFARELLAEEIAKYPPLAQVLDALQARKRAQPATLYERWIEALATQWAEDALSALPAEQRPLWRAKRLQTGLASWTTLRHVTVLVNERSAAECGEEGIEPIVLRPPRGAVEPDPATFETIAALFDETARLASSWPRMMGAVPGEAEEPLQQGIVRRLRESAAKARQFADIARRRLQAGSLTSQDYESILDVGRIAEHHFLVFKSLAREDLALATPDPMAKIVDVAGGGPAHVPFLLAALGRPLEWDHVVPYYGRRQIVKGAVYSFYELVSKSLLNDEEWRQRLPTEKPPAWIRPYLAATALSCPPRDPF
jgi:hypothetical protein